MKKYFLTAITFVVITNLTSAQCSISDSNVFPYVYNGNSYEIVKENKTWIQAAQCAVASGGKLIEINSQVENDSLFYYAGLAGVTNANTVAPDGGGASYLWIGGNDIGTEGNWVWDGTNAGTGTQFWQGTSTGTAIGGLYNNWGNEPDDWNGQDGLGFAITNWPLGVAGEWNDVDETNTLNFVIEYNGILSVNEKKIGNVIIYPNPAQDKILIEHDLSNKINEIKIVDITGKIVKHVTENLEAKTININVSDLSKGIYFIHTQTTNGNVIKKIVID